MIYGYIVCGILFAYLFYNVFSMGIRKNKEIMELQEELTDKDFKIASMRSEITMLQLQIQMNSIKKSKPIEIPKGTIEAVRYAMIHNHPDNGGDAEKFILYKNCYDKLTGGMK